MAPPRRQAIDSISKRNTLVYSSTGKAVLACSVFACAAIFGCANSINGGIEWLPLFLYYVILIINTFFSIRTFSDITPSSTIQTIFDAALALSYCMLAFSFNSVSLFSGITVTLYFIALGKYAHLNRLINSPGLLRRKIRVNALGASLSICALGIAALGLNQIAAWVLCIVFLFANIYLLAINPMYQIEAPKGLTRRSARLEN